MPKQLQSLALALLTAVLTAGCTAGPRPATSPGVVVTIASPSSLSSPTPGGSPSGRPSPGPAGTASAPAASAAIALVQGLPVKGRAPKTGYSRDEFGPAWSDVDRNGCDSRNDILRRDLKDLVVKAGTYGCVAESGTLPDPYSGQDVVFVRGNDLVQIDHVVSLSDAWQKGAQQWDAAKRLRFANDPLNLLATSSRLNIQKSDSDAASWLPPLRSYWCTFVLRQAAVKQKYGLWLTQAEQDTMLRILATCPAQPIVTSDDPPPTR